mgnify:CR=1 FL=1
MHVRAGKKQLEFLWRASASWGEYGQVRVSTQRVGGGGGRRDRGGGHTFRGVYEAFKGRGLNGGKKGYPGGGGGSGRRVTDARRGRGMGAPGLRRHGAVEFLWKVLTSWGEYAQVKGGRREGIPGGGS